MKTNGKSKVLLTLLVGTFWFSAWDAFAYSQGTLVLVGKVPGIYLGKSDEGAYLSALTIEKGIISDVTPIASASQFPQGKGPIVELKNALTGRYDIIYPGMINLHNHTKQNVLPVWGEARGQFENRFEWRAWGIYKKSVSSNMNPWIEFGKPMSCAAFRWSSIQAMVLGTTYLQGASSCIKDFGIHQVEDGSSFRSNNLDVLAPTDLVLPGEMVFVWNTLRPSIEKGQSYEEALKIVIHQYCPSLKGVIVDVNGDAELKILGDQDKLKEGCGIKSDADEAKFPDKFVRYIYWIHKTIAAKKKYFASPNAGALIAHLAEGRAGDKYNSIEYALVKLLGLNRPHVNFVHGVGIPTSEYPEMAKTGIGLIWSPFSNLLLYGETLNVAKAKEAGIEIALGSDWLPTGTRGVLEELHIARDYIDKMQLAGAVSDRDLYDMVTANPAAMINLAGIIGTIAKGAMGSVVVLSDRSDREGEETFKNFVTSSAADVNLVVVDGKPLYGDKPYLEKLNLAASGEVLSSINVDPSKLMNAKISDFSSLSGDQAAAAMAAALPRDIIGPADNGCGFNIPKIMVHQESLAANELAEFKSTTGLDLDRFADIQKLIAIGLLTQSKNVSGSEQDPKFAVTKPTPVYSCADMAYLKRSKDFVLSEIDANTKNRANLRKLQKLGSVPKKMAESYGL
jgi:cytosine/adenosine deaminase-related metal-dependent hydrolase